MQFPFAVIKIMICICKNTMSIADKIKTVICTGSKKVLFNFPKLTIFDIQLIDLKLQPYIPFLQIICILSNSNININ